MKRYILITIILVGTLLLALQFANVHASTLRDFRDMDELGTWLEQVHQNKPPLILIADSTGVVLFYDICVPFAEALIKRANEQGYKADRYRITSPDYYRYWYNEDPYWQPNEGHGGVWVKAAGRTYLIEPSIPMAWELTVGYAGTKTDTSWQ